MENSTHCFHVKAKILSYFQIFISVHLSSYNRFENDMKHFLFYLNKVQGMYRESCMLTDKKHF